VHEKKNYFSRDVNYIIQDFHDCTVEGLIDGGYSFIQFNTNTRKDAVRDIGQGLNYLHLSLNSVHGNLKPSNVLIKSLPKGHCRFVITDYWYSNHLSLNVVEHYSYNVCVQWALSTDVVVRNCIFYIKNSPLKNKIFACSLPAYST
jgi:serine/threonine protein kinase